MRRWWPFVLLVIVGASRWAISAARPDAESTLTSQTIGCAWATLIALAFLPPERKTTGLQPKSSHAANLRWLIAGAMLFGGPSVSLLLPSRTLDSSALTIALALTTVIIAIAAPAFGTESSAGIPGRMWPALASVGGLLLVLTQPSLGDLRTDVALILAPTLTGIGAVLFCGGSPLSRSRVPIALLGGATLFAVALGCSWLVTHAYSPFSVLAVSSDGSLALVGVLTLDQLGATRWSSQFTWVPLLIILEGIVLVRAHLTVPWSVGLILLFVAGVYLLLPQVEETTSETSPIPTLPG